VVFKLFKNKNNKKKKKKKKKKNLHHPHHHSTPSIHTSPTRALELSAISQGCVFPIFLKTN
jgi:hypothetical protein